MSKSRSYTLEVSEKQKGVAVRSYRDGTVHITLYVTQDEMNRIFGMIANAVQDENE